MLSRRPGGADTPAAHAGTPDGAPDGTPDDTPDANPNEEPASARSELARALYTLAWWIALPALPLRLWWRGRREPGYRAGVGERFGRYAAAFDDAAAPVWIHAVSVGETRAAAPLIQAIRDYAPGTRVLLTHMTAAGRATGQSLFGDRVIQAWLPYDLPFAVERFVRRFRPTCGLLVETELWPNLLVACRRHRVPVYLVSARLSERSARRYAHWLQLAEPAFRALAGVAAQSPQDGARLAALGAPTPAVTGNLKFDFPITAEQLALGDALRARFGTRRPTWVAASTRDGEEALLLDALAAADLPADALLVLVPRHPQRFEAVAQLLRARGIGFVRRSSADPVGNSVRVVLGDSMGEMIAYFAAADVAVIGGSFLPLGGQNLIEAMGVGRPVIVGPHMFNFAEATAAATAAGGALQVEDAPAALGQVAELLRDPAARARMGEAGRALWQAHRGAAQRTLQWLAADLGRRGIHWAEAGATGRTNDE